MHSRFVSLLSELSISLANRIIFAIILIEEIIYDRLIKLILVDMISKASSINV